MKFGRVWWGLVLVLASACGGGGETPPGGAGDGDGDGDATPNDGAGDGDGDATPGDGDGDATPGDGDGDGDLPDGLCEAFAVRAEQAIPDMLIVLDRSGSMGPRADNGFTDRWTPSVNAVNTLTSDFDDKVQFGLMLFPSDNACGSGRLLVPVGLNANDDIVDALDGVNPGGGTPTSESLELAFDVIGAGETVVDVEPTVKFVMLVTDGQPTCPSANGTINADTENGETEEEHQLALQQDFERTLRAIEALAAEGVRTFVIGYDAGVQGDVLTSALAAFAEAGGTENFYDVQNESELTSVFDGITSEAISCSYALEEEPEDVRFVKITLDGTQLNLDDPNGWTIDGKTVTIQGAACDSLQNGDDHVLRVDVQCEVVIPD